VSTEFKTTEAISYQRILDGDLPEGLSVRATRSSIGGGDKGERPREESVVITDRTHGIVVWAQDLRPPRPAIAEWWPDHQGCWFERFSTNKVEGILQALANHFGVKIIDEWGVESFEPSDR